MKKGYQPKAKLGSGARFAGVQSAAASEYVKKGYSPKAAVKIGAGIAAKAGRAKFGKAKMQNMAKVGK